MTILIGSGELYIKEAGAESYEHLDRVTGECVSLGELPAMDIKTRLPVLTSGLNAKFVQCGNTATNLSQAIRNFCLALNKLKIKKSRMQIKRGRFGVRR